MAGNNKDEAINDLLSHDEVSLFGMLNWIQYSKLKKTKIAERKKNVECLYRKFKRKGTNILTGKKGITTSRNCRPNIFIKQKCVMRLNDIIAHNAEKEIFIRNKDVPDNHKEIEQLYMSWNMINSETENAEDKDEPHNDCPVSLQADELENISKSCVLLCPKEQRQKGTFIDNKGIPRNKRTVRDLKSDVVQTNFDNRSDRSTPCINRSKRDLKSYSSNENCGICVMSSHILKAPANGSSMSDNNSHGSRMHVYSVER